MIGEVSPTLSDRGISLTIELEGLGVPVNLEIGIGGVCAAISNLRLHLLAWQ